jgi:hypothetical protein
MHDESDTDTRGRPGSRYVIAHRHRLRTLVYSPAYNKILSSHSSTRRKGA